MQALRGEVAVLMIAGCGHSTLSGLVRAGKIARHQAVCLPGWRHNIPVPFLFLGDTEVADTPAPTHQRPPQRLAKPEFRKIPGFRMARLVATTVTRCAIGIGSNALCQDFISILGV